MSGPLLRLWVLRGIHTKGGPGWVSTLGTSASQLTSRPALPPQSPGRPPVAMVEGQRVTVGIVEEGLEARAGVDRLALERHAARLELSLGALEVVHVELDRAVVGVVLHPKGVGLHDRDGQVAALELLAGHAAPLLRRLQAEHVRVEVARLLEVLGRDGDEVDAVDEAVHGRSL